MEFHNTPFSGSTKQFLHGALEGHHAAIWKAVTIDKKQQKPSKKLQFSKSACRRQSTKCFKHQSSRSLSGKSSSSANFFLFPFQQVEQKFWRFLASFSPAGGRHSRAAMGSWSSYRVGDWKLEVLLSEYIVPFHNLPPVLQEPLEFLFYNTGLAKAQSLQGEVDRMLEKGTLELVDHPGQGCIFLRCIRVICPPRENAWL